MSIWEEVAAQAARRRRDRERRERARDAILHEYADQRQQVAAIPHRNERAEQARELRARQEAAAARFDAEAAAEIERLKSLLRAAATEPARDLAEFRQAVPDEPAPTIEEVAAPPRPEWSQYAPQPPGFSLPAGTNAPTSTRGYPATTTHSRAAWPS
jgi:hypothetical protein